MRDYITTVFNLIVGLVNPNKLVMLALIGLAIIVVWQVISLMFSFNARLAKKCRKISKFLTTKGLSADNYNKFISLVAKMPQEFIRGYKTFEHASFGLPSDYIKRFDSIDVEVNGGLFNHGKSLLKSFIYGFAGILAILSLAIMGEEAQLTGYSLADALLVPLLFVILGKVAYYIFMAIKQQQYRVAVDEFNEMLDIMNDKIENNDTLPGPDVLSELEPIASGSVTTSPLVGEQEKEESSQQFGDNTNEQGEGLNQTQTAISGDVKNDADQYNNDQYAVEELNNNQVAGQDYNQEDLLNQASNNDQAVEQSGQTDNQKDQANSTNLSALQLDELDQIADQTSAEDSWTSQTAQEQKDEYTETELNNLAEQPASVNAQPEDLDQTQLQEDSEVGTLPKVFDKEEVDISTQNTIIEEPKKEITVEEQKRGRGRPKKVSEGELIITNDKQFEEALERAEKLMRKSEEALSTSQAKRVEKALKELVDAMTKYKEEKKHEKENYKN